MKQSCGASAKLPDRRPPPQWTGRGPVNESIMFGELSVLLFVFCCCIFCMGVHRVTDLEKFPVRVSRDEAPTPLPVVGPLFISLLLFHLSRVMLGAWRFGLFRCVYFCFHNRLDLIREPAFYWVFYFSFPIYPCLFHHS